MYFIKLAIIVLLFASPLGLLCGLAARQFAAVKISRFPPHAILSGWRLFPSSFAALLGSYFYGERINPLAAALIASLIVTTGLIAWLIYALPRPGL